MGAVWLQHAGCTFYANRGASDWYLGTDLLLLIMCESTAMSASPPHRRLVHFFGQAMGKRSSLSPIRFHSTVGAMASELSKAIGACLNCGRAVCNRGELFATASGRKLIDYSKKQSFSAVGCRLPPGACCRVFALREHHGVLVPFIYLIRAP